MPIATQSPFLLRPQAGDGIYGWCGIEMASVMAGSETPCENYKGFNAYLRSYVIQVNDMAHEVITATERADALWPILPGLFGSQDASKHLRSEDYHQPFPYAWEDCRFPQAEVLMRLGFPETPKYRNPWGVMSAYAGTTSVEGKEVHDFYKGIEALKTVFMVFWEYIERNGGPSPRADYTEENIQNARNYIATLDSGIDGDGEEYGPSRFLRNFHKGGE